MGDFMLAHKHDLERLADTENWFTFHEFYTQVAQEPSYQTYVEVGVWKGHSVTHLAKELQKTGKEFSLFAVDLWEKLDEKNELWQAHSDQMPILRMVYNHNLLKADVRNDVFDMICDSAKAADSFDDGTVDFCFLDASHDYESVVKDIKAWLPKMKTGGTLAGHDVSSDGVNRALQELFINQGIPYFKNEATDIWAIDI